VRFRSDRPVRQAQPRVKPDTAFSAQALSSIGSMAATNLELAEISRHVWETKYRDAGVGERSVDATWRRVAAAAAGVEGGSRLSADVETAFHDILSDFRFLPGGRILAGAGTDAIRTLANAWQQNRTRRR